MLLRTLAIFLAPLGILVAWQENALVRVETSHSHKRRALESMAGSGGVLVLGSSNALYGICPRFLGARGVNLANVSQSLDIDLELLQVVLDRPWRPSTVVVAVSYLTAYSLLEETPEAWRLPAYRHAWGLIPSPWDQRLVASTWSRTALFTPRKALALAIHGGDLASEYDPHGCFLSLARSMSLGDPVAVARSRLAYHHSVMRPGHRLGNMDRLEKIAELASRAGAKTLVVLMPVLPDYHKGMDPAAWELVVHDLRRMRDHGRFALLDLSEAIHDPAMFVDADHLNAWGAAHVGRIMAIDLGWTGTPTSQLGQSRAGPEAQTSRLRLQ